MKSDSELDSKQAVDSSDADSVKNPELATETVLVPEVVRPNPLASQARGGRKDYSSQRYEKDPEIALRIRDLARTGLSKKGTALMCGLSPVELTKWYGEDYDAGQSSMEHVVAAAAMEQVMAGNPQMIMFVAKTKLGWSEHNVVEHVGTVNAVVSARPLSRAEFEAKYLTKDDENS